MNNTTQSAPLPDGDVDMGDNAESPGGNATASTPNTGSHTKDDWADTSDEGTERDLKSRSKGSTGPTGMRKRRRAKDAQRKRRARERLQQHFREQTDAQHGESQQHQHHQNPTSSSDRPQNDGGASCGLRSQAQGHQPVSYTHLRAHETGRNLVCRLLLEKKK